MPEHGREAISDQFVLSSIPYFHMLLNSPRPFVTTLQRFRGDSFGGLGIKQPNIMNKDFLMKMIWSLVKTPNDLWCHVLIGKYGRGSDLISAMTVQPYDSPPWRALEGILPKFQQNLTWQIGNSSQINLWLDKRLPNEPSLLNMTA